MYLTQESEISYLHKYSESLLSIFSYFFSKDIGSDVDPILIIIIIIFVLLV